MRTLELVALGLLICATPTLAQVDWDKSVDFSAFETYSWMEGTHADDLTQGRIVAAIEEQLTAAGLEKTTGDADLHVVTHASVDTEKRVDSTSFDYGGYYGWRGWGGWGSGSTTVAVRNVEVGTLMVDMLDGESDKLVWRGIASGTVKGSPDKAERQINKAVAKMFKKFPPN